MSFLDLLVEDFNDLMPDADEVQFWTNKRCKQLHDLHIFVVKMLWLAII